MCLVDDRCERPRVVRGPAEHGTSCFAAGQLNWCKCCVALRRRRTLARAKDASRVPGTVAGASTNESKYAGTDPTTLSVLVGHRGRSTRRESHHRSRHNRIARKIADVEPESTSSIWETQIATCWKYVSAVADREASRWRCLSIAWPAVANNGKKALAHRFYSSVG